LRSEAEQIYVWPERVAFGRFILKAGHRGGAGAVGTACERRRKRDAQKDLHTRNLVAGKANQANQHGKYEAGIGIEHSKPPFSTKKFYNI
jgi:hypothetical protein